MGSAAHISVRLCILAFISAWPIEPTECRPLHESESYHGIAKLPVDETLAPSAVQCRCLCAMISESVLPGSKLEWFYHWVPCQGASPAMCPVKVCTHAAHHHHARRIRRSAFQDIGRFIQVALPFGDTLLDNLYTATKGAVGLRKTKSFN
ncbi:uncharacterized protein LOC119445683 [Dermacentor silvarum]|uniref:uncharacterized protein LOC119445683 n=1 Tax=Dermacentor silvarum TaxID=543639 RepID=UPI001899E916|nr:uncharacterized protein LOC119445683 [Dermacentor silvarum]